MTTADRGLGPARLQVRWCTLAVAVLACLAYGVVIGGDFVFDDLHSVAANPALVEPTAWWRSLTDPSAFSATGKSMYRPALLLSFVANLAIGTAPWSLKAGNLLLHVAAAVLLFGWLRRLSIRMPAAFVMATAFAVHPLASEAINLISGRSELLLGCGLLLALRCHLAIHRGRGGVASFAGMIAGALIACGSKETGVVLPAVMLAQALCVRPVQNGANWRRTLAVIAPVVVVVVAYLIVRRQLLGHATVDVFARVAGDPTTGHGRTLLVHLATMGTLLPRALLQMAVPVGLSLDPPVVFRSPDDPWSLLGWASVLGLTVVAAWPGPTARVRRLGTCLAWALALPWIVVPLNMPLAEHRLYGPMLGIAVVLAPLLPRLRLARGIGSRRAAFAFAGAVSLGIVLAASRSVEYRDEVRLWQAELTRRPESFNAWWGLGTTNLRDGRIAAAIEPLATAHAMRPQHPEAASHYAEALLSLPAGSEQPHRAMAAAAQLVELLPRDPWSRTLRARAYLQVGHATGELEQFEAAERDALSCLAIAAPKSYVYLLAAEARQAAGDFDGALAHLDTSLQRGLDHVSVRLERAKVLRALGRHAEARRELARAQQQAPMDPGVLFALRRAAQPPR